MAKLKGLGRGLDALLSDDMANEGERMLSLRLDQLVPGKYQPRTHMDEGHLAELAESIKSQGLMQPILARGLPAGNYEIIAGERRWRASHLAGLREVPVLVRNVPDEAALKMALVENIQREDLNPLEEALGLQRLIHEFGMTHQMAAESVSRSRPAVSNLLRLLQLSKPVQAMLMDGRIDMGHARALLPLRAADQIDAAHEIARRGLSAREAERLAARMLAPPAGPRHKDRDVVQLEEALAQRFATTVQISANRKGAGRVIFYFDDLDQLDGLLARMS